MPGFYGSDCDNACLGSVSHALTMLTPPSIALLRSKSNVEKICLDTVLCIVICQGNTNWCVHVCVCMCVCACVCARVCARVCVCEREKRGGRTVTALHEAS